MTHPNKAFKIFKKKMEQIPYDLYVHQNQTNLWLGLCLSQLNEIYVISSINKKNENFPSHDFYFGFCFNRFWSISINHRDHVYDLNRINQSKE